MSIKPVWQMVHEAVTAKGGNIMKISEIIHYIKAKYDGVNRGTIHCQITVSCVNRQSRVHYAQNSKPRIANSQHDFLYYTGKGEVTLYNPEIHGVWEIAAVDGRLIVRRIDHFVNDDNAVQSMPAYSNLYNPVRKNVRRDDIPRPSQEEIRRYLEKWETLENYTAQERALEKLFWQVAPINSSLDDILIKIATLNTFYSTNIKSVFIVAKHILCLNIDERLSDGDETLVDEIANVTLSNGKVRNEFSFATKYCSHHKNKDNAYPIYDSYVEKLLCHFRDAEKPGFSDFHKEELRKFSVFKRVICELRKFYSLEMFSFKEIDKYLWQLGKEKFPNRYGKKKD